MAIQLVAIESLVSRKYRSNDTEVAYSSPVVDRLGRPLTDLRLSVTERCNFRCTYCMPRSQATMTSNGAHAALSYDELVQIVEAMVDLGVTKVRLTGGEPLVRPHLAKFIERLSVLPIQDLCLTTNGSLLAAQASALAQAGLHRLTVSLDALDEVTFRRITDGHTSVATVLQGIDAARRAGLGPIKINMVVQRGVNEHAILPMADWARREALELRFIEYMDVGTTNGWSSLDVVTAEEVLARVHSSWPLEVHDNPRGAAPAESYRYTDGRGKVGMIAAISRPFCGSCTRARVSARGELYSCLFAPFGVNLVQALRNGADLRRTIAGTWQRRVDRYSELRASAQNHGPRPEMSVIGG